MSDETPCGWQLIVDRYKEMNMLDKYMEIQPLKNWSTSQGRRSEEKGQGGSEAMSASNLEKVLKGGNFAVTSECGPPRGADAEAVRKKGGYLKGYVDGVNVTDNQTSVVRMSSIAAAVLLKQMGFDPIMQMVCRDRNRIALQSDILGASALGLDNVLCLSGDHQKFGDHPTAKNVFDIDSMQLIETIKQIEGRRTVSGRRRGEGGSRTCS